MSTTEEELEKLRQEEAQGVPSVGPSFVSVTSNGKVHLSADDIDLIARLVVERMSNANH